MPDTAAAINALLKKRGSPMAGMGQVFVAAGKKYGVDPRLVVAISGIESSFGKHTYGAHNAWGWGPGKPFGSWQEGIQAVTQGLRTGYYDRGLRTPDKIVHRYAPGSDGNDTGNWVNVVNQFLGQMGATVPAAKKGSPAKAFATAVPSLPKYVDPVTTGIRDAAMENLASIASGRFLKPTEQLAALTRGAVSDRAQTELLQTQASFDLDLQPAPDLTKKAKGSNALPPAKGLLVTSRGWKETAHAGGRTSGLGWGDDVPADIMAPPGKAVGAPASGVITRIGSAQEGGQSAYLRGDDGYEYWLGHIDVDVPEGSRIQANQVIARISGEHPRPHLHITRRRLGK